MSLQDITITASINSIATQSYGQRTYIASTDDQSFPIETITGSNGGVWPNFVQDTNYTIDLVVNITQSWSGVNDTIAGLVPFVHNTMEEFINGEFSGSNYVVSNGNLNDAQCEQFLTVNTTPVAYKVFPFYKNNIQDPVNVYLDGNTALLNGEMYIYYYNFSGGNTRGIYAKIARIDALGNDNTLSLQELEQFSYTDTAAGKIIFDVLNITKYPDYYFYEVTTNITSLVPQDDNYYLHSLTASFSASSLPASVTYLSSSNGNWAELTDNLNYFDGGKYVFGDTPNIPLQFTSSFKFTVGGGSAPANVNFGIIESTPPDSFGSSTVASTIAATSSLNLGAGTYTWLVTGSGFYSSIKNYFASLLYSSDKVINNVTASFIITQSQSPQISTSSFVIEPYLLSDFAGSDCDVLLNNYSQNDINNFYRRVLYDDGSLIPSNLQQIISGTAEYAEVTDYLYSAQANTLPRYEGVRTTSPDFNKPFINGFSNKDLVYINSGSLIFTNDSDPNVEQTTTYFAYFTSLKSNNPIFKGTTSPVIKYLIREDGKVFNPATDNITYYNIIGSFERGKYTYATLLNDTTIVFNNSQSILLSGESYTPILYSISASNDITATFVDATSNILNFNNLQGVTSTLTTPASYSFYGIRSGTPVTVLEDGLPHNAFYTGVDTLNFYSPGAGTWNTTYGSPNVYEPYYDFVGIPSVKVRVTFQADFFYTGTGTTGGSLLMELWRSNTGVSSSIKQKYIGPFIGGAIFNIKTEGDLIAEFSPSTGDKIFATLKGIGVGTGSYARNFSLKIETLGINVPSVQGPFWFTGSANSNTLTSSIALGTVLQGNYKQVDIPNSGFDPIQLPCEIQVGDEIRFEYDESNTYKITETGISGSGQIFLTLNNNIPTISTLNINHFTVRRKVKDAITGISLNANNILPIYEGFLFPQYPSSTIKRDLPTIINDLSERNLI